jgi:hypothetical protein
MGKVAVTSVYLLLFSTTSFAQPTLRETNWKAVVHLSFIHDSVLISDPTSKQLANIYIYTERHDTLTVANPVRRKVQLCTLRPLPIYPR